MIWPLRPASRPRSPFTSMRARWRTGAWALAAVGCAAPPVVTCVPQTHIVEKSFFDGTWAYSLHVETRDGPPLDLPTDAEIGNVSFVFGEDWLYGLEGLDVTVGFGVCSHLRLDEEAPCGWTNSENDGRPSTEHPYARVDWSRELAGAVVHDLVPDADVEPISLDLAPDYPDDAMPRFELDVSGAPLLFEIASDYLVRPDGCADAECESQIRVRHRFVRR